MRKPFTRQLCFTFIFMRRLSAAFAAGSAHEGTGVHNAIDAEDEREDDNQRQQEQNLPRQRHKHAQLRLTDRAEEIGRDRLDAIDKREEHIDAEVALRELEIHLAARSEHADDLPREQLEAEKRDHRQHRGRTQRQQVGVLNTVVQLSAVIVADDGLDALRNADDKGHEDHVHLGDDARTGVLFMTICTTAMATWLKPALAP
mgnify:CR=1 FL=1